MDDATRLIADLEEKLADLDHKVATYRQGLADEFTRHEHRLLRDVPETLCATVQSTVARSLVKYPAISPALARAPALTGADSPEPCPGAATPAADATAAASTATAPASTSTPGTGATDTATSTAAPATAASRPADHEDSSPAAPRLPRPATPPPSLLPPPHPSPPAATDDLGHMSDSPEDREAELRGLFTPTFLPLLDISINRMRSPPTPPKPRSPRNSDHMAAPTTTTTKMDAADPARAGPGEARPSSSPLTCTQLPTRPPTIRRATDDLSTSSALSDKSDSKSRRSALRRSSSSSKPQSPRRVRFEVAGTGVLPTSSPSDSSQDLRQPPSDGGYTAPALEEDDPARPRSVAAILGLTDAEDNEPPPKKVSSSQALRALSRMPLDSDTVWIPVTQESTPDPNSEGRGADAVKPNSSLKSETSAATSPSAELRPAPAPASPPRRPAPLEVGRAKTHLGTPLRRSTESWDSDSDESSDDDFLSMAKPKSFRNKTSLVSSRPRSPSDGEESRPVPARRATTGTVSNTAEAPRAPTPPPGILRDGARQSRDVVSSTANRTQYEAPDGGPDYSDVFDFEESEGMPARPPTPPREESDSEPEDSRPQPRQAKEPLHMYSTSPAVSIPGRQAAQMPPRAEEAATVAATNIPGTTPKSQVPAVGSYRGRSITMPVVVNPSIHERAAALGEFNSFVGSLDGRSGMDDGDVSSFRASLAAVGFDGTPRSLTQRMMMEEREELRGKKG